MAVEAFFEDSHQYIDGEGDPDLCFEALPEFMWVVTLPIPSSPRKWEFRPCEQTPWVPYMRGLYNESEESGFPRLRFREDKLRGATPGLLPAGAGSVETAE